MTKDELYQEFVSVTHFDASKIPGFNYDEDVHRITRATVDGVEIISDCEGIGILFHSVRYGHAITYFHKEDKYEARLKADMVAILTDIYMEIEELDTPSDSDSYDTGIVDCEGLIQEKINALKAETEASHVDQT